MFKDNHMKDMDHMFRSALDNATEEVPSHVWDDISRGLDRIERRNAAIVWMKRSAIAAAVAAAVATLVVLRHDAGSSETPREPLIALVENTDTVGNILLSHIHIPEAVDIQTTARNRTFAQKPHTTQKKSDAEPESDMVREVDIVQESTLKEERRQKSNAMQESRQKEDSWQEIAEAQQKDRAKGQKKVKTAITLSGIAGSNNPQGKNNLAPLKSPSIGQNYDKTTIEHTSAQTTYGIPLSLGAGVKFMFNERWALGVGLNYTLLTNRFSGKYIKVHEDGTEDNPVYADIRNFQHYIGIPVNAYYNIVNQDFINFYAYAGGTVEKGLQNKYEVLVTPVITHKEKIKGLQLSLNAGIGVEFLLGKHLGLYIDPSLRYYFYNGQPKSIRSAQPLMLGFEMGLRFNL